MDTPVSPQARPRQTAVAPGLKGDFNDADTAAWLRMAPEEGWASRKFSTRLHPEEGPGGGGRVSGEAPQPQSGEFRDWKLGERALKSCFASGVVPPFPTGPRSVSSSSQVATSSCTVRGGGATSSGAFLVGLCLGRSNKPTVGLWVPEACRKDEQFQRGCGCMVLFVVCLE